VALAHRELDRLQLRVVLGDLAVSLRRRSGQELGDDDYT